PNFHPTAVARTMFVDSTDSARAEAVVEYLSTSDATMRAAQIRVLGGAVARIPSDATAYAHRSKPILMNVVAFYNGEADRENRRRWATEFWKTLQPNDDSAYVGFLADDGQARIRAAYPGSTWDRLTTIKSTYDPTNVFRLNHNV